MRACTSSVHHRPTCQGRGISTLGQWGSVAVASLLVGCGAPRIVAQPRPLKQARSAVAEQEDAGSSIDAPGAEPVSGTAPVLIIDDPAALSALAGDGSLGFSQLLGLGEGRTTSPLSMFALPSRGVGSTGHRGGPHLSKCRDGSLRDWLDTPETDFELVGITNRLDQRDNRPGTCGDVRFVFRMRDAEGTRLPIAFAVVYEQPDDRVGCRDAAQSWMQTRDASVVALRESGGPLSREMLAGRLTRVELNGQSFNDVDGRACNQMAVFVPAAQAAGSAGPSSFALGLLDFSPGWPMYTVGSRGRIGQWLTQPATRERIVQGIEPSDFPRLSGKDQATRNVLWWFTLDGGRREFRPEQPRLQVEDALGEFSGIMRARHFPEGSLPAEYPTVPAFLHRLDGMTCTGCHARRSVGGFHLPGANGQAGLVVARSPHLQEQLQWRAAYVTEVANGGQPERIRRVHNASVRATAGSHCSVASSPLPDLRCEPGLDCVATQGADFGTCWSSDAPAGGPCSESSARCDAPGPWFPGGHERSGTLAATVPSASDLLGCKGKDDPWACAMNLAAPMAVGPCSERSSCRDGFACVARTASTVGACVPVASLKEFRLWGRWARGD